MPPAQSARDAVFDPAGDMTFAISMQNGGMTPAPTNADTAPSKAMRTANGRALRVWPAALLALLALMAMLAAAWHANRMVAETNVLTDQRAATRNGRILVERSLSLLKDVQSGTHGFAITGRDAYLDPYRRALDLLPATLGQLRQSLKYMAPADVDWDGLDALIRKQLALAAQEVADRRRVGKNVIDEDSLFDEGKETMDGIRARFAHIEQLQQGRIAHYSAAVTSARASSERAVAWAAALAILLTVLAGMLFARERAQRKRLEERLRMANADLEATVARRTAELVAANRRLAAYAVEQDRAIEAERRRLAREVHDQIGQVFTAIRLIAGSLPRSAFPPGQEAALNSALDMGIASARRVTADLRPPLLDDLGLEAAVQHSVQAVAVPAGIACEVAIADHDRLSPQQALSLFRIVQEAVTNVLRHARARRLRIAGQTTDAIFILGIEDDGRGIGTEELRPGALGLTGMRERAALLGGVCEIGPGSPAGTRVEVRLPLSGG